VATTDFVHPSTIIQQRTERRSSDRHLSLTTRSFFNADLKIGVPNIAHGNESIGFMPYTSRFERKKMMKQ
jgi:hypothetical protein